MPNKKITLACALALVLPSIAFAQKRTNHVPAATLLIITKAEDERRWDDDLRNLFSSPNAAIRQRAALAAGRIGNEDSVAALIKLMEQDKDSNVRSMAAFAIGEVESETGANALLAVLRNTTEDEAVRARAMEALGKIAAALPGEQEARQRELGAAILDALKVEAERRPARDERTIILALTAALRSRPANAGPTIARFLSSERPRVRMDAANALARLRLKDGNEQLRRLLTTDPEPLVRANAARVLGVSEDKQSLDPLVARARSDPDSRVRVSAIRALASLKDPRAAESLLKRGELLAQRDLAGRPAEINEILEIATTLGRLLAQKEDQAAISWLRKINSTLNHKAPEIELAFVRIAPLTYLTDFGSADQPRRKVQETILLDWRAAAALRQAWASLQRCWIQ